MSAARLVFVTSAASLLLFGCARPQSPPPAALPPPPEVPRPVAIAATAPSFAPAAREYGFADPDRRRKLGTAFAAIHTLADETAKTQKLPALTIGIVVDGELVDTHGTALPDFPSKVPIDADAVFRIGSLTKSFTGLAVLALRDEGKLSLDDPLTRYLPEAAGLVYPTRDSTPITLRQLLTHTSGLPRLGGFNYTRSDASPSEKEIVDSLKGFALENPPGTKFVYSNLGFALLGLVVGRVAKMPYRAFVTERILKPLRMSSSTFAADEVPKDHFVAAFKGRNDVREPASPWMLGASEGAGGIYSTTRDLGRYLAFQLGAYPARDGADDGPVRRASVRESHFLSVPGGLTVRTRFAEKKGEPTVAAYAGGYGYGWGVSSTCDWRWITHNGAVDGFASSVAFLPDYGVGVVVLADYVDADLDELADLALHEMKKTGALVPRRAVVRPDPAVEVALRRLLDVYERWDETAYHEMLSKNRAELTKAEREELAGYKATHGSCHGYKLLEFTSPLRGAAALECDKGPLEMQIALDPVDHKITGFNGVSRGLPIPPRLVAATRGVAQLVNGWDDRLYRRHLAPRDLRTKDKTVLFFDQLRSRHSGCKPTTAERHGDGTYQVRLVCDHGTDMDLALTVDEKAPDIVERYDFTSTGPGAACPTR